jgi:folate-dependent phosphoribosylglycinamide formyltransferase PurN
MYLLNQCPDRGVTYEIVCCVTSEFTFAEEVRAERRGIPTLVHPIEPFYEERGASLYRDMHVRAEYDAVTVKRLAPFFPDLLLLDGYLYLLTSPLLKTFSARVVNLHFSDLTLRRPNGGPRFPGLRAVRDAITAGMPETRATVHLVNQEPDSGPPIVRSWAYPVSPLVHDLRALGAADVIKAYVYAHQQWMMRTVAGPLVSAALRLIATGVVDLNGLAAGEASPPWLFDGLELVAPEVELVSR